MRKVFLFQRSLEAKGGPILSLIFGDGGADFGWRGSRNKAKTHGLRDCEVSLNRIADRAMLGGAETNSKSFDVFPASSLNLKKVLVRQQLIVAMPETPGPLAAAYSANHSNKKLSVFGAVDAIHIVRDC
jgi:hypothetical protein